MHPGIVTRRFAYPWCSLTNSFTDTSRIRWSMYDRLFWQAILFPQTKATRIVENIQVNNPANIRYEKEGRQDKDGIHDAWFMNRWACWHSWYIVAWCATLKPNTVSTKTLLWLGFSNSCWRHNSECLILHLSNNLGIVWWGRRCQRAHIFS